MEAIFLSFFGGILGMVFSIGWADRDHFFPRLNKLIPVKRENNGK